MNMAPRILLTILFLVAPYAAFAQNDTVLSPMQLDQVLAPIALYPDPLLAQVFVASTFPLEVVEASRWLDNPTNAGLQGDELVAALQEKDWDDSVKSLVAFPQALRDMSAALQWMEQAGHAFLTQQADVMDSVQRLRGEAFRAGNLQTDDKQKVIVQGGAFLLEPTDARTVYMPIYDASVYGVWPYSNNPPYALVSSASSYASYAAPPFIAGNVLFVQPFWSTTVYDWHSRQVDWDKDRDHHDVKKVGLTYIYQDHDDERKSRNVSDADKTGTGPVLEQHDDHVRQPVLAPIVSNPQASKDEHQSQQGPSHHDDQNAKPVVNTVVPSPTPVSFSVSHAQDLQSEKHVEPANVLASAHKPDGKTQDDKGKEVGVPLGATVSTPAPTGAGH